MTISSTALRNFMDIAPYKKNIIIIIKKKFGVSLDNSSVRMSSCLVYFEDIPLLHLCSYVPSFAGKYTELFSVYTLPANYTFCSIHFLTSRYTCMLIKYMLVVSSMRRRMCTCVRLVECLPWVCSWCH